MTLDDREAWTENNLRRILDIAYNQTIDLTAEKPITFLACALEIYDATSTDEPWYTHLPIPIDGSNNGMATSMRYV